MSTIKIRRSGTTPVPSTGLGAGELAYSWASGADRLYIGTGTESGGVAQNIAVIGGKYFTDMLDHTPGVLASNSAIIVGPDGKIDQLNVVNVNITGSTITTTNANGDLILSANGVGNISASTKRITNVGNPVSNTDVVNLATLNAAVSSSGSALSITGDTGTDTITFSTETLVFAGGTGLASTVSANTVTFRLANTAVTIGSYGSSANVATFTVDQQGRLTGAGTTAISITSAQVNDATALATASRIVLRDASGNFSAGAITVTGIDGGTTLAAFGSSTALTLGHSGTVASTTNISTGATATATTKTINIGTGGASGSTTNINFGSASGAGTATFNDDVTIAGNLTVNGTTVTVNASTIAVDDKNIELGSVVSGTISTTGTVGSITGTGPWTATITGMTSTVGLVVGSTIAATAGTGTLHGGSPTSVVVASIVSATSITYTVTGGTTPTAGTVTNITSTGPTNASADGGGITLKGATDKTLNWINSVNAWTSSEDFNIVSGKVYEINGASVLSGTTLGTGVTFSSLTSVGTITSGTWSGSFGAVSGANLTGLTAGNLSGTIPSTVLSNSSLFVGSTSIALNRATGNLGLTGITSLAMPGSTSGTVTITPTAVAGTTAITIPATTGTLITTGDTSTVTNTMLAGSIAINKLVTSTISGVSLGNNLAALTIGTGLTGTSYNGSTGVTIASNIATNLVQGIASFDANDFTVNAGAVSINIVDGGAY